MFEDCSREILDSLRGLDAAKISRVFPQLEALVSRLEDAQKHVFRNKNVARVALIHRSALVHWPQDKRGVYSNERLEFLGDSFLGYFIAVEAMIAHPGWQEGELSKLRAAIVGTESLAQKARAIGLSDMIVLGKGESMQCGHYRTSLLADAFEAIVAALLLDAGAGATWAWLKSIFAADIALGQDILQKFDAKSRFQQWVQSIVGTPPSYRVIGTESTHEKTDFIVGGFVGRTEVARAAAPNKRVASKIVAQKLVDMVDSGELTADMVKLYFEEGKS